MNLLRLLIFLLACLIASWVITACGGSWMVVGQQTTAAQQVHGESSSGIGGGSTLSTSKNYSLSHGLDTGIVGDTLQSDTSNPQADVNVRYNIMSR